MWVNAAGGKHPKAPRMALLFDDERANESGPVLPSENEGGAGGHYPASGWRGREPGGREEEGSEGERDEVEGEEARAPHRTLKKGKPEEGAVSGALSEVVFGVLYFFFLFLVLSGGWGAGDRAALP